MFFRNLAVVTVCLMVVAVGVVWSLGMMSLLDYKITLLMSLIPPLMIVIGVPNCIYLVNKYQAEFKRHGNKMHGLAAHGDQGGERHVADQRDHGVWVCDVHLHPQPDPGGIRGGHR